MNIVMLIGRLTSDPELKQNEKYTQCKFTLAVNRLKEGTDFINCIAWNKQAELINKYLKKGSQVAIEGRIQTGSYEGKNGKVYTTDVIVQSIYFIGTYGFESVKEKEEDDIFKGKSTIKTDEIELAEEDYPF